MSATEPRHDVWLIHPPNLFGLDPEMWRRYLDAIGQRDGVSDDRRPSGTFAASG